MAHGNPINSGIFCRDKGGLKGLMKRETKKHFILMHI